MFKRLMSFIDKHKILHQDQFGFRKSHSTEMAIISLTQKLQRQLRIKNLQLVYFLTYLKLLIQ